MYYFKAFEFALLPPMEQQFFGVDRRKLFITSIRFRHVQLLLRHSVIGRVDLLGAIPTVTADDVVMTSVHIKT